MLLLTGTRLKSRVSLFARCMSIQAKRLADLRNAMAGSPHKIDAFVIPSEDAHQSEYTAECDNRRAWISGFTGSAGCAVVTQKEAALFTDGRYFLQASQELDAEHWRLMKQGLPHVPTWQEYLVKGLPAGSKIGIDASLISTENALALQRELESKGSSLVPVKRNYVDVIRSADRPERPANPVKIHPLAYAGKSHMEKLTDMRQSLFRKNCDGTVISALDEIAWLLNLRGSDIRCSPVFFAYCFVTQKETFLYLSKPERLSDTARAQLLDANIELRPYETILGDLERNKGRVLVDPTTTNLAIVDALRSSSPDCVVYGESPIALAKAIKNDAELSGMRNCHRRDAVSVVKHFAWLSRMLNKGDRIHETDAAAHLESMRRQNKEYVGLSFDTIAATGANGAIIHYQPPAINSPVIDPNQIYLCDSGAQYVDGTTDITRTYLFRGQPSAFQQRAFTRVLQSHIALDQTIFPQGTTGYKLDSLARRPMWKDGLDFRHGFGHGVGAYLNVHEGPHGIGGRKAYDKVPLQPGMVVTNEPGYYQEGEFGIRIENILVVRAMQTKYGGDTPFLGFEHITFVPIGRRLIDPALLDPCEKDWINAYHNECRTLLEPLLKGDSDALAWVEQETVPL